MSFNQVINNLNRISNSFNDINYEFISLSLDWISFTANTNLDQRTKNFWGSDARNWNKKIYSTFGILENMDMNSASIEFGIGKLGGNNPNMQALENGYQYDKPSEFKDENGNWTFKDERTGIWVTFNGYEGKSFLYDAFSQFMITKKWVELYKQSFDKIIRGVIKND